MRVLVTGATGYVGRRVADALRTAGHDVVPFSRASGGDVTDPDAIARAVEGAEAVAHLVAIVDGTDAQFEAVNAQGTRNVLAAATAAGARRFLHMSALGVSAEHAPLTRYWRTKWEARTAVTESGLDWTVFEPSFVFGRGGGAFAGFERLVALPVTPVIGDGRYRHQPVWIGNVADAFVRALERPATAGQHYELGGPQVLTFDELLDELARVTGHSPVRKLHVPVALMKAQTPISSRLPQPLKVTSDQIVMLLEGTECDTGPAHRDLGIDPSSLADAYAR